MKINKSFLPVERYHWDRKLTAKDGWMQFDTRNDAPHYGNWVNSTELKAVSYVEGDVYEYEFSDRNEFVVFIERWIEYFGEEFIHLDCLSSEELAASLPDELRQYAA